MTETATQESRPIRRRGRGKRAGKPSPPLFGLVRGAARGLSLAAPALAAILLERVFLTPRRYRMPEREKVWMAGAEVWRIPFDAGRLIPLYAWGEGPVVLLVHGFAGRGSQMGAFIAPLRAQGYRVVTFDAPAHGAADGRQSSVPEAAEALVRVAAHLGPLAAVIAHSAGAAACSVALARGMDCGKVVYIAPNEDLGGFLGRAAGFLGMTDRVAKKTRARIEVRYGVGFEALRGAALAAEQSIPALIVHDREDEMIHFEDGARIARAWPGAEMIETRGLGHARILRDDGVVEAAARFIGPAGAPA
ncbi:alpha/beta hydrolase [Antarcticimicrobium luteum]|uniref:Alpha/beta fold hydrolase n=1 Tax=Antarcticimicrobium luteum TaxID=2547397 RepID=A0A4R5UVB3_9RHOB|nr:alpha/beta hydrolase [Antarcticimicrobium luteum]TDK43174.1 alpha/beta fold hydrolase [Antarcticimicrobium luteum]